MTLQERQQLKATLVATSLYYGQDLADSAILLFVEDLEDLPLAEVMAALKRLRRDPKVSRLPLPAVIRAQITPPENDIDEAREASSRIMAAIARFGWPNSEQARMYIGELGWAVVQRQGGWVSVCQVLNDSNKASFHAQWRDLAESLRKRAMAGNLDTAPGLPEPKSKSVDQLGGPTQFEGAKLIGMIRRNSG